MDIVKLLIDTDIGSDIDDALCLAYLLKQQQCEILGITTCSSEPEKRAEIADSICRYVGRDIPIFPGRDMPLLGKQLQVAVHQYDIVGQFPHKTQFPKNQAIDFMKEIIEANPHNVTLLPIGPLTNIGALFTAYPHLAPLVKEISFMGGSYFAEAVSFIAAEWNIKNDPIAAKIVFDSGVPICVAGLDVSLKLKTQCTDFISASCAKVLEPVVVYAQKFLERTNDMYFHDPLVAAYLFENSICSFKKGFVQIGIGSDWGRTYFLEDPNGNVLVADKINPDSFFRHYYETINTNGKDA